MGGGLIQLATYGAQDIYLTGNPQITFFKVVYRRHTNYSMETISQTLDGNATIGTSQNESSCTISRDGDLIHKMYVVIPSANSTGLQFGSEVVQSAELEIGGQIIDYHTKEWNNLWNELTLTNNKALALNTMLSDNHKITDGFEQSIQSPLNFYFCKNPGLALPLIALQYHEVKINFVFGSTTNVFGSTDATSGTPIKFFVDYIYLDTDERRRFAQVSHEYLIEQVQMQEIINNTTQELNFNHPVKELIWLTDKNYNYNTALLKLNGNDRFEKQEEEYFQLRQPFDYHTHIPKQNLSLASRINHTPMPVRKNILKINKLKFGVFNSTIAASAQSGIYFATEFSNTDNAADADNKAPCKESTINDVGNDLSLVDDVFYIFNTDDIKDFQVGHEYLFDFRSRSWNAIEKLINPNHSEDFGFIRGSHHTQKLICDKFIESEGSGVDAKYRFVKFKKRFENIHKLNINVTNHLDFDLNMTADGDLDDYIDLNTLESNVLPGIRGGLRIGSGDNIDEFIVINGIHEICDGGNLNLGRCSKLDKKINVYSFALKPEEHQPSGTCNFSRIDTATLEFGASPTGFTNGHIYAVNYNVLRIMSGMGGLAYSN